jgi:hypothetical protein
MVSSTFTDLTQHRAALIAAINAQDFKAVAMEDHSARPAVDVIDSSLEMVRNAAAYVGVISHNYGQVPECPRRNPDRLSLTQLELNEARRLGRPVLLFIMGDDHDVKRGDVERDPDRLAKLEAFRADAKRFKSDEAVHRVYYVFNDVHELEVAATLAVADLRRHFEQREWSPGELEDTGDGGAPTPQPPALCAEPPYIGSHQFVGRQAQLATLDDWSRAAEPHPVLLFESIGGTGKSMLTWEWATRRAADVRTDWAGRFWYSFYERGAVMADFCQRALCYMTGKPIIAFRRKTTLELGDLLLRQLLAAPWLLVLDGVERVLVAYHRFDAAQLADERAGVSDEIANRDPCAAIRAEDDDLLRALAGAAPSKLLLTSRLAPRALLNASSQPIPGVLHERLPGLRPPDAELLLLSCGIHGSSDVIRTYLQSHCDCHPLVIGALAGLIHDYLPDRGNFDAWAADPASGGQLDLTSLNLVQKRNHILNAAFAAVPAKERELISTLALVSEAVDAPTMAALNPHMPPELEVVPEPVDTREWLGRHASPVDWELARQHWEAARRARDQYEDARDARLRSADYLEAPQRLAASVRELERRGLLQYDAHKKRYDIHPVVRGIAAGGLGQAEKERFGQRVIDHFNQQAHDPYEQAEALEDVRAGLQVVRALLQMGRYQAAAQAYVGDLANALAVNLEADVEVLSLLRPFFPNGWAHVPQAFPPRIGCYLTGCAAIALRGVGSLPEAFAAREASLLTALRERDWDHVKTSLDQISSLLWSENRLARSERCTLVVLHLAPLFETVDLFVAQLERFAELVDFGQWAAAEEMWQLFERRGRNWPRWAYRAGYAEYRYAQLRFFQGELTEAILATAEVQAAKGKDRSIVRKLLNLRGSWELERGDWKAATTSLTAAVRMAREVGKNDAESEALLAIAKLHLQTLADPPQEAQRLERLRNVSRRTLATLWLAIGDHERATEHALAAYEWAWADGEPYVHRHDLEQTVALLRRLEVEPPQLAPYDASRDEPFPWEQELAAAITSLHVKKEGERAARRPRKDGKPPI